MAIALHHVFGWYPLFRHFCISDIMWFCPFGLAQAHFSTRYVIWEWSGAEFALFLKIASWISSGVTSANGMSVS
jgi:hypothetical protein